MNIKTPCESTQQRDRCYPPSNHLCRDGHILQHDPSLPEDRPPLGIPWQQWAHWGRLALVVAALVTILMVAFAGLTTSKSWLWSTLSR